MSFVDENRESYGVEPVLLPSSVATRLEAFEC